MTKEQAIEKLKEVQGDGDIESGHCTADEVLCDFLVALGYADVVAEYNKVHKWYA